MVTLPAEAAGLTAREVRSGVRESAATRILVARRTYPTDPADLWEAITDAERLPRWFLPVSGDLQVGGRYQLEGNAGGVIERCDPPRHLAVTWEMGPNLSWLTVSLSPAGGGTMLELVHEAPVDPGFWEQFGPGAVGIGWDLALVGLGIHLDTGQAIDPAEAATFTLTAEGRSFVGASAEGWASAAVADGDRADAAKEAAERAVAFYTTAPEEGGET